MGIWVRVLVLSKVDGGKRKEGTGQLGTTRLSSTHDCSIDNGLVWLFSERTERL